MLWLERGVTVHDAVEQGGKHGLPPGVGHVVPIAREQIEMSPDGFGDSVHVDYHRAMESGFSGPQYVTTPATWSGRASHAPAPRARCACRVATV